MKVGVIKEREGRRGNLMRLTSFAITLTLDVNLIKPFTIINLLDAIQWKFESRT
jgi:hypothetical protein